jgi:hypothetical protein
VVDVQESRLTAEEPPEPSASEKATEVFDEKTILRMVGKYTLIIVAIISACLFSMGFGWPWWIAGLGPIVLIPMLAVGFSKALDMKIKKLVK